MWTTPQQIQQLVKQRLGVDISEGKAAGLLERAQLYILRACEDRPGKPPFVLGPRSNQIASQDKRRWLATPKAGWNSPGSRKTNYIMWEVDDKWVGMRVHQDEPHQSYLFFRKEMCRLRCVGPADEELSGVFERAHKMRSDTVYPDAKKALDIVSRRVSNNDKRITIPRVAAIREDVPFVPLDDADAPSITVKEANGMKLFFYPQNEDLNLAFESDLWAVYTKWTKWVCAF